MESAFLTSELDGGEWSDSRAGRFTPEERATGTHSTVCWVGPRAGLDVAANRKIPAPCRESNPGRQACSLIIMLTALPRLHRA
jgi:hypothetical protein